MPGPQGTFASHHVRQGSGITIHAESALQAQGQLQLVRKVCMKSLLRRLRELLGMVAVT